MFPVIAVEAQHTFYVTNDGPDLYVTFRSRLPVPPLVFGLWLYFWKPGVVDQRVGFFLDGSSGPTGTSSRGRPAWEGSLLRRTWRGMPVEGKVGEWWNEGEKMGDTARKRELQQRQRHFPPQCSNSGTFWDHCSAW